MDQKVEVQNYSPRKWMMKGSNPGGVWRFWAPVQTGPVQWVPVLFPGGKAAGAWR